MTKYKNFNEQEVEILDKLRELRDLMMKYYPDNTHTSCAIIEKEDGTYLNLTSDVKHDDGPEIDVVVWDKKGE